MQSRARWPLFRGATLLALPVFLFLALHLDFLVDDAFISYRYGRHLADGHGLTWNIGESPPVEGFSNFLWTLVCALFERLHLDPTRWTRALGATCGVLLVALVARLISVRTGADRWTARLSAVFFAVLPPVAMWATSGLETMAFSLCVFALFERLVLDRERPHTAAAAICGVLAALLRADGFVWAAIALAAATVIAWRERDRRLARAIAIAAGATAAATLAYLLFRWSYFGELEPNTARVKVALGGKYLLRGAQYVLSLLLCVIPLPLAIAGGAARAKRDALGLAAPALVAVLTSFAYLIVLGGDWMMMYRMLVPALPFAALLFAAWLAAMHSKVAKLSLGGACVVLAALPCFDLHAVPRSVRELAHFRWSQEFRSEYAMWKKGVDDIADWIETGRALGLYTRPGQSMVLGNIGALGYYAPELVVYDTQGLTNKEPLLPVNRNAREMPGHDRKVRIDVFDKYAPTYFISKVVDASTPLSKLLPKNWQELDANGEFVRLNETARARFEIETHALDPSLGFREGRQLVLIRFRR